MQKITVFVFLMMSSLFAKDETTFKCIDIRDGEKFTYTTKDISTSQKIGFLVSSTLVIKDSNGVERYFTEYSDIYIKYKSIDGKIIK